MWLSLNSSPLTGGSFSLSTVPPSPSSSGSPSPTNSENVATASESPAPASSPSVEPTPQPTVTVTETAAPTSNGPSTVVLDGGQFDVLTVGLVLVILFLAALTFAQMRRP